MGKQYTTMLNEKLQESFLEIEGLREQRASGVREKTADLAVIAFLLALQEGADEQVLKTRFEQIRLDLTPRKSESSGLRIFKKEDVQKDEIIELMKF